jgi:hypothetical protein
MNLRVKPVVDYLENSQIEAIANSLLERYQQQEGKIIDPPIPIEFIAEDFLGYQLLWENFSDPGILGLVNPNTMTISFNLGRPDYFDNVGWEFTLAHEVGHPELGHFENAKPQLDLGFKDEPPKMLHREHKSKKYYRHELQAEYFAACCMMPRNLLRTKASQFYLLQWESIRELANQFSVSLTAMAIRLEELNLIYREGKKLYHSKEDATGQKKLF